MGIIFYVSISGVFPFEEDDDIISQLVDSKHLFSEDPWGSVSEKSKLNWLIDNWFIKRLWNVLSILAIDLIKQLMEVKMNRRLTASKALANDCFAKVIEFFTSYGIIKWKWKIFSSFFLFIKDDVLYEDLLNLEKRVGQTWLTEKRKSSGILNDS